MSIKKNVLNRFPGGSFTRNVLTVVSGTTIAQAIPLAISPLLTRIYNPSLFGLYALYMSVASLIMILATGRYELAIVLPEKEEDAVNIVGLAISIAFCISFILMMVNVMFGHQIASLLNNSNLSKTLYFMPLTIFFYSVYQTIYYWANRKKYYKRLAASKVSQALTTVGVYLALGYGGAGIIGMVGGDLAGIIMATVVIGWKIGKSDKHELTHFSLLAMKQQAKRYRKFPIYSLNADFINVASNQIPVILLNKYFGISVVGYFNLAQRVLGAPISLIGKSVRDVFRERASSDYRTYGNCKDIYIKTFKGLFLFSLIPFILFFFFAPSLFSIIFGREWVMAGEYTQILSIVFFLGFTASPLSYVLYIAEKQNYDLVWQIFLFLFTLGSIFIGIHFQNVKTSLLCFSLSYAFLYIIYLFISFHFAKGPIKEHNI